MGMVDEGLRPGMKDRHESYLSIEVLWIVGQCGECLGGSFKEEVIDDLLIPLSPRSQICRQREDYMEVVDGQELSLSLIKPALFGKRLALWAMPVTA